MKKIKSKLLFIALYIICAFPINIMAQVPQYVRDYFKENILSLDPIEGIYDAQTYLQGYNAYQVFSKNYQNMVLYIRKTGDNTYDLTDGRATFYRIGETNAYTLKIRWAAASPTTLRVYLENNVRLNYTYEMPEAQMQNDMGREYQRGMGLIAGYSLIKTYPTTSDYEKALQKQVEQAKIEAQRIAEEKEKAAGWSGSGFALNKGYVVTNYHVVEEANSINIYGIKGDFSTSYAASVVATDKVNDLAILKINDKNFTGFGPLPYSIKMQMAEVGDDIFVLGYPLIQTMGNEIKLTNGIINSLTGFEGDVSIYQMSAPIQPGNSGGPMFDRKGNIIGIICAGHKGTDNVGYAIKTSYLKNLAESTNLSNIFPTNNTIAALPLSGQVKKIKPYVFLIKCSSSPSSEENNYISSTPSSNISQNTSQIPEGYIDLGLPSGTKWKSSNESGFFTYEEAIRKFGNQLPSKDQLEELKNKCSWTWTGNGYNVTGPNGNSITLPAAGSRYCDGSTHYVGSYGYYWSSTPDGSDYARNIYFDSSRVYMNSYRRCNGFSVRLVQD